MLKLLKAYLLKLIEAVAAIGFYDAVMGDLEKQKAKALLVYNDFVKDIKDQDHWKKLSMQEQQALGQNEINYKHLIREMDEAISHLIKQKWTTNIRTALFYLDDVRLHLDYLLDGELTERGQQVKPSTIIPAKFAKADYIGRISIVQIAINLVQNEIDEGKIALKFALDDTEPDVRVSKMLLKVGLGKALRVLQQELEDIEVNGMPKSHTFEVPPFVVPEVPEAPEKKTDEQLELKPDKK